MAPGRRAQLRAGAADAALEPAGRRPRRPGLPHRAVPARRPGDLERQLVRRPLHPHLQRPLPAAGGAARDRRWSAGSPSSPPPTSSTAWSATAGERRRAGRRSGSRPASSPCSPTASSTFALGVAFGLASLRCPADRPRHAGARSPPRPAPWPARSPPPSSPASSWPGRWSGASRVSRAALGAAGAGAGPRRRPQHRLPRTGPVPLRLLLLRRDPALVRRRPLPHPRPARGAAAAPGRWSATCSPRPLIWLAPERDGRQRGPPRRPLRRPGPGRGAALAAARAVAALVLWLLVRWPAASTGS